MLKSLYDSIQQCFWDDSQTRTHTAISKMYRSLSGSSSNQLTESDETIEAGLNFLQRSNDKSSIQQHYKKHTRNQGNSSLVVASVTSVNNQTEQTMARRRAISCMSVKDLQFRFLYDALEQNDLSLLDEYEVPPINPARRNAIWEECIFERDGLLILLRRYCKMKHLRNYSLL